MKISEKYRSKALACEKLAREVPNHDFKCAWEEIAVAEKATRYRLHKLGVSTKRITLRKTKK